MSKNDGKTIAQFATEGKIVQVSVEGKTRIACGEIIIEPNAKLKIVSIEKK